VSFEEARGRLGLGTQVQGNDQASQRATPVLLGLLSLVTLMAHRLQQRAPGSLRPRGAAWYPKNKISFSDALGYVRAHIWKEGFCMSAQKRDSQKLSKGWLDH